MKGAVMRIRQILIPASMALIALCLPIAAGAATRARTLAELGLRDAAGRISAGERHTCQVVDDGTVRCWGDNGRGQLGDGTMTGRPTPVTVVGFAGAVAVSVGSDFSCALLADGTVRCWGGNTHGQL